MIKLFCYWGIFVSFIYSHSSYSQGNPDEETGEESIDTVVIYRDPVVVKKTIYYRDKGFKNTTGKRIWAEIAGSPFYTSNNYIACPGHGPYLEQLKRTTSPLFGFNVGANLLFFYNNFLFSAGIGYSSFREKFKYESSSEKFNMTNSYSYANIPVVAGYRIINKSKLQTIVSVGAIIGKLLDVEGKTNSEEDSTAVREIKDVRKYYDFNYEGIVNLKFLYPVSSKILLGLEPYFRIDLTSVTRSREPFTQQRQNLGINGNLIFVLK